MNTKNEFVKLLTSYQKLQREMDKVSSALGPGREVDKWEWGKKQWDLHKRHTQLMHEVLITKNTILDLLLKVDPKDFQ